MSGVPSQGPPRGRTILVVEDEPEIRSLVENVLGAGGYRVVATGEPAEVVELARREQPDLVLCDIAMPGMDGYGVLKALQSDPTTVRFPVVFLTAHREFTERVRAFRFGVVDYVTKPFTREILLRKIERVLEGLPSRTGVAVEGGQAAAELVEDVQRESRSGVLTLTQQEGESRVVISTGRVVEGSGKVAPAEATRAQFQELDPRREEIVSHDPPRLPGDTEALQRLEALPQVLRTVLVVDDNEVFRVFLRDVLSRRGFTVYEADDGDEALRLALEKRPWLILTDVAMPRVDGFEFCRRVRSHSLIRHTPLIFLSGWDDYKDRYRGMEAGADEYLSKDTPVRELLIRIQLVLKRYADLGERASRGPGMEGDIEVIGAPGLLQMCHLGRLSGACSVRSGDRLLDVRFRDGEIVDAMTSDGVSGADAVYDLLGWTHGHFNFTPGDPGPGAPLGETFNQLVLEGCRRLDEHQRRPPS